MRSVYIHSCADCYSALRIAQVISISVNAVRKFLATKNLQYFSERKDWYPQQRSFRKNFLEQIVAIYNYSLVFHRKSFNKLCNSRKIQIV